MWYSSYAGPLKISKDSSQMLLQLGRELAAKGWLLRSHGTTELDAALLAGCLSDGAAHQKLQVSMAVSSKAYELADRLIAPQRFVNHAERDRSAFLIETILGAGLRVPSRFVLTWSLPLLGIKNKNMGFKEDLVIERLLEEHKIPVFDLANAQHYDRIKAFLAHAQAC